MERKKTITLIFLLMFVTLICSQVYALGSASETITSSISSDSFEQPTSIDSPKGPRIAVSFNPFNSSLFNSSAQPKIWFYVDLVIIICLPILFIVQTVLNRRPQGGSGASKLKPEDETEEDTLVTPNVAENEGPNVKSKFANLVRFGFLAIFIQNIVILIMFVALLVTSPQAVSNPAISKTIMQIYTITFHLDFVGAILAGVGLILLAPSVKRKVQCYVAAGFWFAWVGLGIYPRINSVVNLGIFVPAAGVDFAEWAINFYAVDLFLITFGSIALAIGLFYTANVLAEDKYLKGKAMLNSFGIGNYVITAGFTLCILLPLTFGATMTEQSLTSILLLWIIFIFGKFLIAPVIGLIGAIAGFSQLNPSKTHA